MNHWVQTHTDSGSERFCVEPSQCFVQAVIGIDPIVMKNKTLGSVPKSCICGNWDNLINSNSGINPSYLHSGNLVILFLSISPCCAIIDLLQHVV